MLKFIVSKRYHIKNRGKVMAFNIETLDKDKNIDLITIYDDYSEIKFTNFGMRIVDWKVNGRSIVLGPDAQDDLIQYYEENPYFFGATIGRYGGRIDDGKFELNDQMYELEQNDSEHNLHGGSNGLHTQICDYEIINEDEAVTIIYNAELLSKNDHFPGDIQIKVFHRYDLSKMEWTINYEATSTEDTLFNPMNHVYFNLNNVEQRIDNHEIKNENLQMYTLNDKQIVENEKTVNLNETIDKKYLSFKDIFESGMDQIKKYNGIDHPIKINEDTFTVTNGEMEVSMTTDNDVVVLFTLNEVDWNDSKNSIVEHGGFTLEAQSIPDDIHLYGEKAPSILRKGKTYKSETSYKVNVI